MVETIHDYIVVGGGSAGCVVANRLVKAGKRVLLLEEGPRDNSPYIHMPATFVRVIGTRRSFLYRAEGSDETAGRPMYIPQGRTLGGGSSLNAMIYIRGQAEDYDHWANELGCSGWDWQSVLPFFRRSETNERLSGPMHGTDGPLRVSDARNRHPMSLGFVKATQEAGYGYNDDFNGASQAGAGFYQTTTFEGRRGSTAATYLKEVLDDANLTVATNARVTGLQVTGRSVAGVTYVDTRGRSQTAAASGEVILTAGALSTPKILMLSGIGPADRLKEHGIAVTRDLRDVGLNYQDHLEVPVFARCREPISLLGNDRGLKALRHGLQYVLFRSGMLTSNVVESGAFLDTNGDGRVDTQFHVIPVLMGDVERPPLPGHGLTLNPCYLQPESRGEVRLRSADPSEPILLEGNYLSEERDVDAMVRGLKAARDILRQPSLQKFVSEELMPSNQAEMADADLARYVREYAKTVYHPAGTCRMGSDDNAVVDTQLRVNGIARLRICDASVMPKLVSGNTNAPTIMIAERCADFILN